MMSEIELDTNKMKLKEASAFKLHLDLHGESKASEVIEFLLDELQKVKQERDEAVELFHKLGNEFDRMHKTVASRYVAERIFEISNTLNKIGDDDE